MTENEKSSAREVLMELSPEEIETIVAGIPKDRSAVRNLHLYHRMNYQVNADLINNSLIDLDDRVMTSLSLEEQIKVSAITYIKNKALDQIIQTFENRATELSKELAKKIAVEVAESHPDVAKKIEAAVFGLTKGQALEIIETATPVVNRLNAYFHTSILNENEQFTVIGTGLLTGAIYMAVKENKGFKNLVGEVKEFQKKAKEFVVLVAALEEHVNSGEKSIKKLKEGLEGSQKDFREMYDTAKTALGKSSNIHSKRLADFFYTKVIKGKDVTSDGNNKSILDKQVRINANVQKSIDAATEIAGNLGSLIGTTEKMFALLKYKPSKDLQKAMNTAKKVAEVASTVKTITAGFAMGGPIGALAALGSSPLLGSALGGGSDATTEALKQINKKLDLVLDNQKKLMDLQLETMKMIKDVALVLDQYHQQEMLALSELRDVSLVNLEISKTLLNKDIRSCERLINFQLSSVWKDQDFRMDSFNVMNDLKIITSRFGRDIRSLADVRRLLNSVEANGFEKCQNGIVEAFGGNSVSENPLRSLFSSSEDENLLNFQRKTYAPLVSALYAWAETSRLNFVPLHIPAKNFRGLQEKEIYYRNAKNFNDGSPDFYELDDLISTKGLERYLGQLLVLYPFLEVDKAIWHKDHSEIVETYLNNSNAEGNQNIRSHYFLSNALKLVQSAIAQETILAGEPLLPKLFRDYRKQLLDMQPCTAISIGEVSNSCVFRKNKLLMKNFMAYLMHFRLRETALFKQYRLAYNSKNLEAIANLIGYDVNKDRLLSKPAGDLPHLFIKVMDDRNESIEIRLPTPDEVSNGTIIYSENMPHLLKMQQAVIEALAKVAPIKTISRGEELAKILTAGSK